MNSRKYITQMLEQKMQMSLWDLEPCNQDVFFWLLLGYMFIPVHMVCVTAMLH